MVSDFSSCSLITNLIYMPIEIRVRVALVGIIADHPAMCKLCGFADHSHNIAPCTKCKVTRAEMFSDLQRPH
jgi:hypothetical protein